MYGSARYNNNRFHAFIINCLERLGEQCKVSPNSAHYRRYNISTSPPNPTIRKETELAKVNYQYEKRQKELEKKRKKEQKEKLKQLKKNIQPTETQEKQQTPQAQPPEK